VSEPPEDRARRRLVIVESPAKAKTIKGYLGPGYTVEASVGHIRDLPTRAADIPAAQKGQPWARLGVNVDSEFEPLYVVDPDKRTKVAELKRELKDADELLLATDEDREGEAIAWHLLEVLKPAVPVRRMVFHEITRDAIRAAADDTRDLDLRLVDAQETRRIIDRLYGYEVSPVLWKKVMQGLSAGRVQSVATRLVVDRERERIAFVAAGYWDLEARLDPGSFTARLVELEGARVATGRDFGQDGRLRTRGAVALDESGARSLAAALQSAPFSVRSVDEKAYRRSPAAPFMTSTLQQEASRKLRFSSQTTMRVAQRLYENGYITYMRTDSTTLSESAIAAARSTARQIFGAENVADAPRQYNRKVKNAQEAHEAIRPSGDAFRTPGEVGPELTQDELALYDLIWKRTVASQMSDARGSTVTVRIGATASDGRDAVFSVSGTVITHRGFLAAYEEGRDDESANGDGDADGTERRLPPLKEGDALTLLSLDPEGHSTQPPARYTEATLVKALEERGIGRPSTYASIMGTILDRGYVWKRGGALVPSFLAFAVVTLLEKHFGELVDYDFTARMEEVLDLVADGHAQRLDTLRRFYYGEDGAAGAAAPSRGAPPPDGAAGPEGDQRFRGLHPMVGDLGEIDAREINSIPVGAGIVLRVGRYGPYLERETTASDGTVTTDRAPVPDDLAPDELTVEKAEELLSRPSGDRELGADPESGRPVVAKAGRFGPYVTEVLPDDAPKSAKPRTASLFKSMSIDTVTLDEALRLLSLPRTVGVDPSDGVEITAQNGRYGPYLKKGSDSRSLGSEDELFTVSLDDALAIFAQPKPRGRGRAAAPPLRELGDDPVTGRPMVVREGRFGAYVTDGETNATLRKGDAVETLSVERAAELLAEKRAKGPAPKKRSSAPRKASARKSAAGSRRRS
jgi:DNA topoisomerase I